MAFLLPVGVWMIISPIWTTVSQEAVSVVRVLCCHERLLDYEVCVYPIKLLQSKNVFNQKNVLNYKKISKLAKED